MAVTWGQGLAVREGRIGRVLIAFMTLGFVAVIAAVGVSAWVTVRNQAHTRAVNHTYEVELALADVRRLMEQGETSRRGYLLSEDPSFLRTYHVAETETPGAIARLTRLTRDNPVQRRNLAALRRPVAEIMAMRAETNRLVSERRRDEAVEAFRADVGVSRMQRLRAQLAAMGAEERRLLTIRDGEQRDSVRLFYITLGIAAVLLVLVAAFSILTVLRYTRDLTRSRDILEQLNDSLEAIVTERTADLSRANEEIQRFAYIVSHDLRSPLVNVMGFTAELEAATVQLRGLVDRAEEGAPDLVTEEDRLAAREDLPEAIGFIRTSTQKMDRLINAILQLSRQGRRVLAPEPVAVESIVSGIRASLAHRLDEEGARIETDGVLPSIVTDRLGIEQILSNLVENAVKYRHPERPVRVTVTGGSDGARAWVSVTDNGRGIDARDHERVFDLFRRSGAQDQPGEGIGLAHVRALAYRLGGTIDLRSTLGEGSTFRLTLPVTLVQEPAQ